MSALSRFKRSAPPPSGGEPAAPVADPRAPKGRATPSRKEAEAARKQGLRASARGRVTKEGKKASREAEREARARQRAGMMMGDERYMPARDRGAKRRFVRDFVDARITVAEYFIFIAIAVLLLGFVQNPALQSFVSIAFFAVTALIIIDTTILLIQLNIRAKKEFPDKADRRGLMLYAVMRALQLRRLRLPPPMVTRGGKPIQRGPDGKSIS
ncbi:MAG: DUF3043 domain-containing protein [Candidatus Nanopelagicales bacterium]